jgi:LysR family transcriptional regulator, regulator of abg operon
VKLNQLRNFIAVVEHGSLRLAAARLGLTATALSKSLTGLEEELHVQLIVRHSRGITVTPFGHAFLIRARRIAGELHKAMEEMAQLRGQSEGTVTVGASPTPAITLLPDVVAGFRLEFPAVRVVLRGGLYDKHLAEIRDGSMDLAVGPVPAGALDPAIAHEPLFYNQVVIAARRGHAMAGTRSLAELADCEWVLTSANTQGPGAAILDAFAQHGLPPPRRVMQCEINWALPALLAGTNALCALPQVLLDQQPQAAPLQAIGLREQLPRYPVCLIHRADMPLLPAAEHFATLIRRHAHYYGREHPQQAIA